ncbi:hypothetical protein BJ322DRAFT_352040 [Thelephora terrestris]|uniref:Glucose receptor Git3 N-terminal domain-containing protein n=1 Tax=Thelephora terrestris TaxID=56493 RepID=A0A9P6H4N3_9AGAM|nr:hypothetical protein BJ322DRAFT_352040 [Thelephora terrestris]
MNHDQMSLFNYLSGAHVTITASSLLPNGNPEILGVHIFRRERMGVLVLVITSTVSLIAAFGLLLAIASSWWNTRKLKDPHLFVRTGVAPYFVSMLVYNVLQSVGSIMNAQWVQSSSVNVGVFCASQAVTKHISDIGVAIWALVIAFHTFLLLFFGITIPRWASLTTLVGANAIIVLLVCLGPTVLDSKSRGPFYGISGYWCWITDEYKSERITMDYMIMFLSAILSFILYTLVFLRMRGNVVVDGSYVRFRLAKSQSQSQSGRLFAQSPALKVARQMLLYPVAYTIVILPITAARFCEWSGRDVPFTVTVFSDVVFLLSGTVNVLLFCATRRILPARSVAPGWRCLSRLAGFTGSNQDTEKSFACRGIDGKDLEKGCPEESTPRSQLDLCPQVRIKIEDALQSGENRGSTPNADRGIVPNSRPVIPQRPLPALVREERKSMTSGKWELTVVGEGRWKEAR